MGSRQKGVQGPELWVWRPACGLRAAFWAPCGGPVHSVLPEAGGVTAQVPPAVSPAVPTDSAPRPLLRIPVSFFRPPRARSVPALMPGPVLGDRDDPMHLHQERGRENTALDLSVKWPLVRWAGAGPAAQSCGPDRLGWNRSG